MEKQNNSARFGQGAFNTLAQTRTANNEKPPKILIGKGSDISQPDYGKRKGKTKVITQAIVLRMIDIAKQDKRKEIEQSLWNTWHCQSRVYTHENRLYATYCKNRFCTNCLGIRKADIINRYHPVLKHWKGAHFVTLTVKSCPKYMLNTMIEKCIEGLQLIIDRCRKRSERGKGKKIIGLRSLECNFNPVKYTYNPHFHIIVPDYETADILEKEWLKQWTYKDKSKQPLANKKGQRIDKIDNIETQLVEVVKYGVKVFTDPEGKKKLNRNAKVYARAFYNIITAMRGHRLFASIGFSLPKIGKEDRQPALVVEEYEEWLYVPDFHDWQHGDSELTLFGYIPDDVLQEMLAHNIDISKE